MSKEPKERHAPHDIATRVQALTLKVNGFSDKEILEQTGVASRTIRHIYSRARKRGFDPDLSKKIELKHIEDGKRTGRPRKGQPARKPEPEPPNHADHVHAPEPEHAELEARLREELNHPPDIPMDPAMMDAPRTESLYPPPPAPVP